VDIIKLDEHVHLLRFNPVENSFIGFNMVLIKHYNDVILIDTGYPRHYEVIKNYLLDNGLTLKQVIISHWHSDHFGGIEELDEDIPVHGSILAYETISKYNPNRKLKGPNRAIVDKKHIEFGENNITIEPNPGHSKCGTIITINDKFMFVGDDVIRTYYNKPVIPFCADQDLMQQAKAIENILIDAYGKVVIPSHGEFLYRNEEILKDLDDRLKYLKFFMMYPTRSYDDFVADTEIHFEGVKWHKYNMEKTVKS